MSFVLAAFVGNEATVATAGALAGAHRVSRLGRSLHLVELAPDPMVQPRFSEQFYQLTPQLAAAAVTASIIGDIGFIEAEFFGGDGAQASIVWRNGDVVFGPLRADDEKPPVPPMRDWPINQALRFFGVKAETGCDEFDTRQSRPFPVEPIRSQRPLEPGLVERWRQEAKMRRARAAYGPKGRAFRLPVAVTLPWGKYERHARLLWRVRILLWLPLLGLGWALFRGSGLVAGAALAVLFEAVFSYRKPSGQRSVPRVARNHAREEARAARERWSIEAVPSPGGWQAPSGCLPAWNWAPPDGMRPRLDRVPRWVQTWYTMPFIDRYAHAWMWRHGGWDVLPPSTS